MATQESTAHFSLYFTWVVRDLPAPVISFHMFAPASSSRVFAGEKHRASQQFFVFVCNSDLSRAPAPLCDHGHLDATVN